MEKDILIEVGDMMLWDDPRDEGRVDYIVAVEKNIIHVMVTFDSQRDPLAPIQCRQYSQAAQDGEQEVYSPEGWERLQ
jgi:hypothetical protein